MTAAQRRVIAQANRLLVAAFFALAAWVARWWINTLSTSRERAAERDTAMATKRSAVTMRAGGEVVPGVRSVQVHGSVNVEQPVSYVDAVRAYEQRLRDAGLRRADQ